MAKHAAGAGKAYVVPENIAQTLRSGLTLLECVRAKAKAFADAEGKSDAFEKPCDGSAAMGFRSDGNDSDSDDASGANDDQYAVLNRVNGVLNKELDILLRGQQ